MTMMMKERARGSKHTRAYISIRIGETPSAFFKQHQNTREKGEQFTQSFIKQREEEKSGYFNKIFFC